MMDELITNLTDPLNGLVQLRQSTLQGEISDDNDRIDQQNQYISDYRTNLTKQFSDMEIALQNMKSQYARMASALGLTTSST